jgi:hypothetical protein
MPPRPHTAKKKYFSPLLLCLLFYFRASRNTRSSEEKQHAREHITHTSTMGLLAEQEKSSHGHRETGLLQRQPKYF